MPIDFHAALLASAYVYIDAYSDRLLLLDADFDGDPSTAEIGDDGVIEVYDLEPSALLTGILAALAERKPLSRLILKAFQSNGAADAFLRAQDGWGARLADAVPDPRQSREEYAFEMSDRLVRWGYAAEFLRAMGAP